MINGAHVVVTSADPEADHALLRDVFKLPQVNDGGYIIFAHHGESNDTQRLFLTCDDIRAFLAEMAKRKIACSAVQDQGWRLVTEMTLPGGAKLNVYQPRHARPNHP